MVGRWRMRGVSVPVAMATVRRWWRRASRIDSRDGPRPGTRNTTILIGDGDAPLGWIAVRWWPAADDGVGLIHPVGWDAVGGRTESDLWLALEALADDPFFHRATAAA